ncbi:MAG: FG-GAP-like repeat-containing protein [Planctomycetota bacterium]
MIPTPAIFAHSLPCCVRLRAILGFLVCVSLGCQPQSNSEAPAIASQAGTRSEKDLDDQSASLSGAKRRDDASANPPSAQTMNGAESQHESSFEAKVLAAAEALDRGDIDSAWKSVKQLTIVKPNEPQLLFLTARVLAAKNDLASAIKTISQIPVDSPLSAPAAGQAAEWMVQQGDLPSAESNLLRLLKEYPNAVPGLRLLAKIYNAQGRRWEAFRYLDRLVRLGDFTTLELFATVDLRDYFDDEAIRTASAKAYPDGPYVRFAILRSKLLRNGYEAHIEELQQIAIDHPDLLEPWVWTATSLLESERIDALTHWLQNKPKGYEKHPEYWYSLGGLLLRQGRNENAARCFSEAIHLDRRHVAAYQGLSNALLGIGKVDEAQWVRKLGNDLVSINDLVQQISYNYGEPKLYGKITDLYRGLGDDVAAFGWAATGVTLGHLPASNELKQEQQALKKGKTSEPAVLGKLAWKDWPLPNELPIPSAEAPFSLTQRSDSGIRMEDVAKSLGINFSYVNGATPNRSWYTIEGIGGGVCALDYDRDGWPDLSFSQGGESPVQSHPKYLPKALYRSFAGKEFADVAMLAGVADVGYGQGMGVADLDQDGFPDLLVANVGVSRMYRNNGDGTFEYQTIVQPDNQSLWNSSIHAADINGDHLPDLIDASYIHGEDAITRWCETANSARGSCNPKIFHPGKNRILFSNGDWNWEVAPEPLLESIQTGYTLGTLVTNLDGREGNDVFFANDVSPNLLLTSEWDPSTKDRVLVERAAAAGVATDSIGRAQASMGISCGDQDRDGRLDIIVTNFYKEPSTLYLQVLPGVFIDGTRQSRLGLATLDQLSFGSQFADLDHDGWLDFVAVNGHIDDLRSENIPFQMPTQILKNERGKFQWLQSPSPGPYFDGKWVGRGLQSLDFNRDGKLDLVATHLDRPAALLENKTDSSNHFIQFELIGTKSERDAIGAILRIECADEFWVTSMSDGDGFFGSNEKLIHMGIARHQKVDKITIQWPSGLEETYRSLDSDQRYRCIEGIGIEP